MTHHELIARLEKLQPLLADPDELRERELDMSAEYVELLPAILAALRDDGWRPIETAPMDGTDVLIFRGARCVIAHWDDDRYAKKPAPFWNGTDDYRGRKWMRENHALAWRPIPDPPDRATREPADG